MTTRYVNTASTAGGDGTTNATSGANRAYASLSEWEAAEQAILSEDHEVLCEGSTADSTACTIDGWTVGSFRITVKGNTTTNGKHAGIYSTSKYRVELSTTGGCIVPIEEKTIIRDLIVYNTNTSGSGIGAGLTLGADIEALNIIARGSGTTTVGSHQGIAFADISNLRMKVKNVISYGWNTGIYVRQNSASTDDTYLVNNTVYGCAVGIRGRGAANVIQAWNNLCKANTDDWNDTGFDGANSGNNAQADSAADAPGTGDIDLSSYTDANTFIDAAGGDFHLNSSGTAYSLLDDAGVGPSSNSNVPTDDIDGDTRSGTTTSIGADVIVAGGTTIAIGVGTLTLTGYTPVLNAAYPVAAGAITLTGQIPALNSGWQLEAGVLNLSGYAVSFELNVPLAAGSVVFAGYEVTTNLQLALQVGNLSLTGFSLSLAESVILSIGSGALSLTGYSSTLDNQFDFGAQGALTLTGYALSVSTGAQTIPIGSNTLLLTNFAPTLVVTAIEVGLGQLTLSGSTTSLNEQVPIGSSDVLLAGLAPTLQTAQPILFGALTLFGLAPSLATSTSEIAISQGALSFSGYAVSLITGYPTVDIGVGTLSIGGLVIGVEQLLLIRSANPRSDAALSSARPDASLTSSRSDTTLSSKRTST